MLSPLLLMLSQDPFLLRHLGERQRYLPPVVAFSGYLAITSAAQVRQHSTESQQLQELYTYTYVGLAKACLHLMLPPQAALGFCA